MNVTIHRVESIEVSEPARLDSGSCYITLKIETDEGFSDITFTSYYAKNLVIKGAAITHEVEA